MIHCNYICNISGDGESSHQPHQLFSELEELVISQDGLYEWKETARWVKFEEDVEEGSNRWSKPHVSSLSMHSLMELRNLILKGTVFLELEAENLNQILDVLLENMLNNGAVTGEKIDHVKSVILKKHRHQFEGMRRIKSDVNTSFANITSIASSLSMPRIMSFGDIGGHHSQSSHDMTSIASQANGAEVNNAHFKKKLSKDAEAANILVGEVDFLDEPLCALIRLKNAVDLGDLTEVSLPSRFVFILLGPADKGVQSYHEVGRSMASSLADEVFHEVAYKARNKKQILAGLDEFLDQVTVLPPGEWDRNVRIEPPPTLPNQEDRKKSLAHMKPNIVTEDDEELEKLKLRQEAGLVRSGRMFGGLMDDLKRKRPWYWRDFMDAFSVQTVASIIFIYFAALAPTVAFGGLLGDATEQRMASIECLVAGLIAGVLYGFFSGQPLTILGVTGPDLVFESIVYDFCKSVGWSYLSFRLWIGWWIALILLVIVAFDFSAYVCYITRFTEESFATLIAIIFIVKAFEKIVSIASEVPIHPSACYCEPFGNMTEWSFNDSLNFDSGRGNDGDIWDELDNVTKITNPCTFTMSRDGAETLVPGHQSIGCRYQPNVFFMSVILFFGTYLLAMTLKKFKNERFFPAIIRNYISNFAVIIAIFTMVIVDILFDISTPKLSVPPEFKPTHPDRGWTIPLFDGNPWYTALVAVVPALLGSILIFMDQQITAVIVNRKEHLMKKGPGYHLDLLVLCVIIIINSYLGIPWYVASTILSINHVRSLQVESECSAPGEKIKFLGTREQRVTHIVIFIMVGLSAFLSPVLKKIPMPVLYGVFLYMGVNSLDGLQFFDRILLFLMPKKYQPDYPYLRQVPLTRVHLFTFIQLFCFILLWLIQTFKQTSILFPIMLVLLIGIRKLLDFVFTRHELQMLDDVFPQSKRKEKMEQEEERRKSIDHSGGVNVKDSETELRQRKTAAMAIEGPFVHFQEEKMFPNYDDFHEDDAITIKPKQLESPDILQQV